MNSNIDTKARAAYDSFADYGDEFNFDKRHGFIEGYRARGKNPLAAALMTSQGQMHSLSFNIAETERTAKRMAQTIVYLYE